MVPDLKKNEIDATLYSWIILGWPNKLDYKGADWLCDVYDNDIIK